MISTFLNATQQLTAKQMKNIKGGKRISDVAPVLIGAFLVGGAAAAMVVTTCSTDSDCPAVELYCNGQKSTGYCTTGGCLYKYCG
jgi:hypothetical protein